MDRIYPTNQQPDQQHTAIREGRVFQLGLLENGGDYGSPFLARKKLLEVLKLDIRTEDMDVRYPSDAELGDDLYVADIPQKVPPVWVQAQKSVMLEVIRVLTQREIHPHIPSEELCGMEVYSRAQDWLIQNYLNQAFTKLRRKQRKEAIDQGKNGDENGNKGIILFPGK